MKVELEKIRLAVTAISKQIVATIPSKDNKTMLHKHDVSSDFFKCIIDYGASTKFNIATKSGNGKEYQVAVVEKGEFKDALYSRGKVIKLLKKFLKEGGGVSLFVDDFIKKNLK